MPAKRITTDRSQSAAPRPVEAILRARVSSKDQEEGGFSLPAQLRLLRDYATQKSLVVLREFVDAETSSVSGRTGFREMVAFLRKHPSCRIILAEKTDRLYRNIADWATLDELGVTIHFVKEHVVVGPDSQSNDQLMHGIRVLMARNYSQNLGEETTKGMLEKARSGIYPSCAPVGYRNADGPYGKRILVPDPETAPLITDLFGRFATGQHSLDELVGHLRGEGSTLRGRKLYKSTVHQILRKRIYMGEFDWSGSIYQGTHEPLVTRTCWDRVQSLLDTRAASKTRKVKHSFAYAGLIRCGHCGCLLVAEIKKQRYVYYHCTGNRGKCPEPYTREEILSAGFLHMLKDLVIPKPILEWLQGAMLESDRTDQAVRAQTITRLQKEYERINARIETMYLDKLDGRVSGELFDQRSEAWRHDQQAVLRRILEMQNASPAPIDEAINLICATSNACELFLQQEGKEQRRLLQTVVKDAAWQDGTLHTTLFEPFEVLRHSNRASVRNDSRIAGPEQDSSIWLLR